MAKTSTASDPHHRLASRRTTRRRPDPAADPDFADDLAAVDVGPLVDQLSRWAADRKDQNRARSLRSMVNPVTDPTDPQQWATLIGDDDAVAAVAASGLLNHPDPAVQAVALYAYSQARPDGPLLAAHIDEGPDGESGTGTISCPRCASTGLSARVDETAFTGPAASTVGAAVRVGALTEAEEERVRVVCDEAHGGCGAALRLPPDARLLIG